MRAKFVREGVADTYAKKEFDLPYELKAKEDRVFIKQKEEEEKPIAYVYNIRNTERIPIYLNPLSLNDFEPEVRAISDKNGNLYVALMNDTFNHGRMGNALMDANLIKPKSRHAGAGAGVYDEPDEFLMLKRCRSSNMFYLSDSYEDHFGSLERLLTAVRKRNPQFEFSKYTVC